MRGKFGDIMAFWITKYVKNMKNKNSESTNLNCSYFVEHETVQPGVK